MTKIINSYTATVDRLAAIKSIREYFDGIQSPELRRKHTQLFRKELNKKLETLKQHPTMYRIRDDGFFRDSTKPYRSFTVHWFTVFYSYDEERDAVIIWFIRSSRSDFSNIVYIDQSLPS